MLNLKGVGARFLTCYLNPAWFRAAKPLHMNNRIQVDLDRSPLSIAIATALFVKALTDGLCRHDRKISSNLAQAVSTPTE